MFIQTVSGQFRMKRSLCIRFSDNLNFNLSSKIIYSKWEVLTLDLILYWITPAEQKLQNLHFQNFDAKSLSKMFVPKRTKTE